MKTNPSATLRAFRLGVLLVCCSLPLRAEQFGLFTYAVVDDIRVTITGYPTNATGHVEIPLYIAGKPVFVINNSAFSGCTGVTSVTIPGSVASIGHSAFFGCTGLTSVTIAWGVTAIGQAAFSGCTGLTSLTIPSSVRWIPGEAFSGCTGLTSVTLPSSAAWIDGSAFQGCTSLTSVTIPSSVTYIGDYAFQGCTGLTSVTIPSSVTSIGDYAFQGCTGLTSVTIPSGVTSIGWGPFRGCTGLTSINVEAGNPQYISQDGALFNATRTALVAYPGGKPGAVTIPPSVTSIQWGAFYGCTRLTGINVEAGNTAYASDAGALLNAARTMLILCPEGKAGAYAIPSSVTTMELYAFSRCIALTSVTIPSSVTTIRWNTFDGCTGLTSVTIPSSVTTIEGYAFSGCTSLTSVTIPSSVISIGNDVPDGELVYYLPAFTGCTALTRMVFLGNAPGTVSGEFGGAAPGFTIYYLSSSSGFTSPTWRGYPATMINETTYPAAAWLLGHGLWYDTDLHTDSDGDGVDLLMAYALDLDPRQNLQARLPVPVRSETTLSLNFRATAPGVTYRAETSTGLTNWTTTGVTQSAPGPDGRSTATIPLDAPRRFLRLTVED